VAQHAAKLAFPVKNTAVPPQPARPTSLPSTNLDPSARGEADQERDAAKKSIW